MRFIKSSISLIVIAVLLMSVIPMASSAEMAKESTEASATVPYTTYMYNFNGVPITTPHAYTPSMVYDGETLGVGNFVTPSDIEVDPSGSLYVVDKEYIPAGSTAGAIDAAASSDSAESTTDAGTTDAGTTDAGTTDAGTTDAGTAEGETGSSSSESSSSSNTVVIDEQSLPEDMRSDISINNPESLVKYIDMLPGVDSITIEYGRRVVVMYKKYDSFSDEERVKVTNKAKLIELFEYITKTMPVNAAQPGKLDEYIAVLPETDNITIDHEQRIAAINKIYNSFSENNKAAVTGSATLSDAVQKMYYSSELDARSADALDRFIALLPAAENITNEYEGRVQALCIAYRKLTADEKLLVTRMTALNDAEYKLDEFQCAERFAKRKGRLVVFNSDYTVKFVLEQFDNDGHIDGFGMPDGVTIATNGDVYVADTENSRILQFSSTGSFIRDIKNPQIAQMGNSYVYRPSKLSVDNSGNIYVVAKNANMGIILLDKSGDFTGFVGAQKVSYSPIDYLWKTILTEEQQNRMAAFVPTEYNNIKIDSDGFLYVTTSSIESKKIYDALMSNSVDTATAPVKRLNPSGNDVLNRWGYFMPCGDIIFKMDSVGNYETSLISDVAISDSGRYTILDARKNRLFTYSKNGELLYAFGSQGKEAGNTITPTSIAYDGDALLVLDANTGFITRFEITHYGKLIDEAYSYYYQYEYDESVAVWEQVLNENANFDIAYDGIANSYLRTGDYSQAMEYYRFSNNSKGYSNAYDKYRTYVIENYLLLVLAVIVVALFLIVQGFKYIGRRNKAEKYKDKRSTLWSEICYAFYVIVHPFDGFWDLTHEKRGSMKAANVILAVVVVVNIASKFFTAYLFNPNYGYGVSVISEILIVIFPFLLWVVANWSVTTLMDGEGKMKDIYIFTAYSLTPTILLTILSMVISHFMIADEAMYLTFFSSLSTVWCGFLVFAGNTTIHRYTVSKSLGSILLSAVGIAIIVFVLLVLVSTYQSMYSFVENLVKEITYRL